jgi:putative ATP-binding cassette transporter
VTRPSIRRAIADGWALAQPFWRAPGQRRAWLLLASVVVLTLGTVWLNVQFSTWNNSFYNTLQNRDLAGFWRQLGVFCALAAAFIAAAVYRQYLQQLLFMRWRTWLTARLLEGWLHPGTAFRLMARTGEGLDNPDQRIAAGRPSFRRASSSGCTSRGCCSIGRTGCSSTNRPPLWTKRRSKRCIGDCAAHALRPPW